MSCDNSYADTIILWGSDQTSLNLYAWQLFIKNRADVFFNHWCCEINAKDDDPTSIENDSHKLLGLFSNLILHNGILHQPTNILRVMAGIETSEKYEDTQDKIWRVNTFEQQ